MRRSNQEPHTRCSVRPIAVGCASDLLRRVCMRLSVKPADAPLLDHTCRTRTSRLRARRTPLAPLVIIRGIRTQPAALSTDGSQLSRIRTENRGEVNMDPEGAEPTTSEQQ